MGSLSTHAPDIRMGAQAIGVELPRAPRWVAHLNRQLREDCRRRAGGSAAPGDFNLAWAGAGGGRRGGFPRDEFTVEVITKGKEYP